MPPEFSRGGEHQVCFHKAHQRYIKATLIERQLGYGIALGSNSRGATPSEYLDRLERVVLKGGKPIIVTSQPFIKGVAPSQIALDELMVGKGYEKRVGLLIFDLFHPVLTGQRPAPCPPRHDHVCLCDVRQFPGRSRCRTRNKMFHQP